MGQLERADDLYNRKLYKEAFERYWEMADMNTGAQYKIGLMYYYGYGVEQNIGLALSWFEKAVGNGSSLAQAFLGEIYHKGKTVAKDDHKAFNLFLKAAEQNHGYAQYYVGLFYDNGYEVEQNGKLAFKWYLKSAEGGYVPAIKMTALFYRYGITVKANLEKAMEYYQRAVELGATDCNYELGCVYLRKGKSDPIFLRNAFDKLMIASDLGIKHAMYQIGRMYYSGNGVEKNIHVAIKWLLQSAEESPGANYLLGEIYLKGEGVEKCKEKAINFFAKSGELGNLYAFQRIESIKEQKEEGDSTNE